MRQPYRAFTLIELLVVIGIISVLLGVLLPVTEKARHKAYISTCASNLRQLGQALSMYANENHGNYPRTLYVPGATPTAGTGTSPDPFTTGGPAANDVSAALWLLCRVEKLPTILFTCPYNDVNEFFPDKAIPATRSNFTDYTKNLGYSYANPYPDAAGALKGYRLAVKVPATFAVMADLNPGISTLRSADPFAPFPGSPQNIMQKANSDNHEREGQNVLYGDGHVVYQLNAFCGTNNDNIYTAQGATATTSSQMFTSPTTKDDSVLLPVD